jgi:glycosyltransferase involved in cell wall biosynthesis
LTIADRGEYESTRREGSQSLAAEVPGEVTVVRTPAGELPLEDLARERKFAARGWLAAGIVRLIGGARRWALRTLCLPDRYLTWLPHALVRGRRLVREEGLEVIWATCPPHSVSLLGAALKRATGRPLIVDYRDDWIDTPWFASRSPLRQRIERALEHWAIKTADRVVLVTAYSRRLFLQRYPNEPAEKFLFIPNGCDLAEFSSLVQTPRSQGGEEFLILHAGALNDSPFWARRPMALFQALRRLQDEPGLKGRLTLAFAGDFPDSYRKMAEEMGVSECVKALGQLGRREVLRLIRSADLLLAMNYEGFASLIPAKTYEYWAAGGAPILLLSCAGAAQELIDKKGLGLVAEHDDVAGIEQAILTVYRRWAAGAPMRISSAGAEDYDRKALSQQLADVLSAVATR